MRRGGALASIVASVATALAACGSLLLLSACGSCDSTVVQTPMPVLASGSFDGVAVDQGSHLVYLADRSHKGVDVVDVGGVSPRFVETVPLDGPPSGLALGADRQRLYVAEAKGVVAVIDTAGAPKTPLSVVGRIQADPTGVDLLDYSAANGRVYAGNGSGGQVVVIDADTQKVIDSIPVNVPVQQPRFDAADGMLYVTAAGDDPLLRVDPTQRVVTRSFPLKGCRASGLAINPSRQLAMVACGGSMALFNLTTGTSQVSRAVAGGDLVEYDASADRFVVASPHGAHDSSIGVYYGDGSFLGSIAVPPIAHGAVIADNDGRVYAPGAAGLTSFAPATCAPPPDWASFLLGLSPFAVPLAVFALILFLYARRQDRLEASGERPVPAWRRKLEYLDEERRRMRELEDAILDVRPDPPA
ncbi:MAG TPA: YncE family protein [Candidatus Dormibacteraeota bacterium]|nr:YncE family protein [Candidatus Dormibacteraeota bacterium]